jgi:hypothetical protein
MVEGVPVMVKVSAAELPTPGVKTVTEAVPGWDSRMAGMTANNVLLLTKVVPTLMPFHCTTEVGKKLAPLTVKIRLLLPAGAEVTLMLFRIGAPKGAATMVKVSAAELPTPGVRTVTEAVPGWANRLAGTTATNWVLLTKVVARLVLLNWTTELDTKLLPVTTKVRSLVPAVAEVVLRLLSTGRLAGEPRMVKVSAAELPAPGVKTVTEAVPAWVNRLAGTTAINWVLLMKVVDKLVPFHCAVEWTEKLVPLRVKIRPPVPWAAELGLILVSVGAARLAAGLKDPCKVVEVVSVLFAKIVLVS